LNSIGTRLKAARLARGLTQEKLASGVATKGFISLVEHDRLTPSLPKLRLLADRLGQPLSDFVQDAVPTGPGYLLRTIELAIKANEPRLALRMIREALPFPLTANQRAELYRLWGVASWALGRKPRALNNLYKAAALAPPDDPELNASIYAEIGAVLGSDERFSASIEASLRALHWLDKAKQGDQDLRARLLTNLAHAAFRLGQTQEAINYLQKALRAATDAESLLRLANAHMALGITARAAGDLPEAIKHCDRALTIHRQIGQQKTANQILSNLGDAYFASGNLAEARRYQGECLQRAREFGDLTAIAIATTELARYALTDNDPDETIRLAREGRLASAAAHDHVYEAKALAVEGCATDKLGEHDAADDLFRRAFRMLHERQAIGRLAEAAAMYSKLLRDRQQPELALEFMRMAYERDFAPLDVFMGQNS
jgi:tetratricopeptide (TPR) repeat protein/DNA-binding XRE family transcriptional regulator